MNARSLGFELFDEKRQGSSNNKTGVPMENLLESKRFDLLDSTQRCSEAYTYLLRNLPISEPELEKAMAYGLLPDSLLPIGATHKVVFGNIRPFLHPDSDRVSFRELRGRYLTASVFMEVATSFLVGRLEMPEANRVFWGLGGSLILVPPKFGPKLKSALAEFNRLFGIPEIGFILSLADPHTRIKTNGKSLLEPDRHLVSGPRDKLIGWRNFKGNSGELAADFVTGFAKNLANSENWSFVPGSKKEFTKEDDISSKLANLPYWVFPADRHKSETTFARTSYIAELGEPCSFIDLPLAKLALRGLDNPFTYFRFDISGMRESLAIEREHGIFQLFEKCRQMDVFFRETIPSICRKCNQDQHERLEVALLHSTCDDVILVTKGKNPETLIERLVETCWQSVGQKLIYGSIILEIGHSASDLSHGAILRLVDSKKSKK